MSRLNGFILPTMSEFDPQTLAGHPHQNHFRRQEFICSENPNSTFSSSGSLEPSPTIERNEALEVSSNEEEIFSPQTEAERSQIRQWPKNHCFVFACLTCTISMFSISRFAILSIDYGAIFLVKFTFLSFVFGIPMVTFFASVGQYLGSGIIDMWRISPVFQGIGTSLLLSQGFFSIYNSTIISWIFTYFRDSFILSDDRYKWSTCFDEIKYGRNCDLNWTTAGNTTYLKWKLEETIPDYFSGVVLMRSAPTYPQSFAALRFQTLFNIGIIWMPVFIALSKGLKSYGRVVILLGGFPVLGLLALSVKVFCLVPHAHFQEWIANTQWEELFYNGQSWICAARECFFTWGILGASILQLSSHNSFKLRLGKDLMTVFVVTLSILILSGFLGVAIVFVIHSSSFEFIPSSFESSVGYKFLKLRIEEPEMFKDKSNWHEKLRLIPDTLSKDPHLKFGPSQIFRIPSVSGDGLSRRQSHDREHVSFLAGIRIIETGKNADKFSGYQVMRLATELVPTLASILGPKVFSPFWTALFYLTIVIMGLGQQMALVHTVTSGIISIRPDHFMQFESSITFLVCLLGYVLCFPMATEFNQFIVYFFDYNIGCGWWLMILYSFLIVAVLVFRGKPYSAGNIARLIIQAPSNFEIGSQKTCSGMFWQKTIISFCWKVILPLGLLVLSVVSLKTCHISQMFDWTSNTGYLYWPSWVREIGAMLQLFPLCLVPLVGIIQTCRHCWKGSGKIFQKVISLCRPSFDGQQIIPGDSGQDNMDHLSEPASRVVLVNYNQRVPGINRINFRNDSPPKYSPPPSYSAATGARLTRLLRQSFRQIRGETCSHSLSTDDLIGESFSMRTMNNVSDKPESPPPDYASVINEISSNLASSNSDVFEERSQIRGYSQQSSSL